MKFYRPKQMSKRLRACRGSAQASAAAVAACVGLAAFGGFTVLGSSVADTIAGQTVTSPARTPAVGSQRQAAFFSSAIDLAKLAFRHGGDFDAGLLSTESLSHFSDALDSAKAGDVIRTRTSLQQLLASVSDDVLRNAAFWDRIEFAERLSYASSGRGARTLDQGQLGLLREIYHSDPTLRAHLDDVIAERGALIDNVENLRRGLEVPEVFRRSREAWVPVANRSDTRPLLMRALDDDASRYTDALWGALKGADDSEKMWDVLTIGGGIISSHAAGVLSDANPKVTQLVIEAGDRAASANFTTGGGNAAIRFNQSNRGFVFGALGNFERRFANRAPLAGSVNISDLAWGKYGSNATNWAESGAITLRESNADVMTTTFVKGVYRADEGAPGRYRVTLRRGDESVDVYTNKVLIGTGINKPKFPGLDEESLAVIARERARLDVDDPTTVPRILTTAEDLYMNALHPQWWENYGLAKRSREDIPDAYVGVGDSVYTALTVRARGSNAPELSDLSRAQRARGISSTVDVFGGSKVPTEPEKFLLGDGAWPGLRARYTDIYPNIVRAAKQAESGETLGPETFFVRNERIKKVRITDAGLVELTTDQGNVGLYNRVIFGTGSESDVGSLIEDFVDPGTYTGQVQDSGALDVVDPQGNALRPDEVGVDDRGAARRVRGEDIYIIGLNAGGDIIPTKQLAGIKENSAAVANWAERVERLVVSTMTDSKGITPVKPAARAAFRAQILADSAEELVASVRWNELPDLSATDRVALAAEKQPMVGLKYELARTLEDIRFDGGDGSIAMIFEKTVDDHGEPALRIRTNFDSREWGQAVGNNPRLLGLLKRLLQRERPLALIADTYGKDSAQFGHAPGAVRTKTLEVFGG